MSVKKFDPAKSVDGLEFYRICGYSAAFLCIVCGISLFLLNPHLQKVHTDWVILGALPGTILLLIGKKYFPRLCSALLMTKFQISNSYASSRGVDINPWFTAIISIFYMLGYLDSVQTARIKKRLHSFWLSEIRYLQVIIIIVTNIFFSTISSGYIFTYLK